jgi:hypothetical protein
MSGLESVWEKRFPCVKGQFSLCQGFFTSSLLGKNRLHLPVASDEENANTIPNRYVHIGPGGR